MIQKADRLQELGNSAIGKYSTLARQSEARGETVYNMTIGEPDFDTPLHIINAAYEAAKGGRTHYPPGGGSWDLREAVSNKFKTQNGLDYPKDQIMITTGAKQSIFNALASTLNQGDEVILPTPCWLSYFDMVKINGGIPVAVPCSQENNFLLTPEALEAAITPKTRWLFLNFPSNPTGSIFTEDELKALGEVLDRYPDILILSDEIYEHLIFDGKSFCSLVKACPSLKERTITINGVSKAFAMTGWRLGFSAGPRELIAMMETVQNQVTSGPNTVAEAAAIAALTGPMDCVETFRSAFEARRDTLVEAINKIPGLSLAPPDGAMYGFVDCSQLIGKTTPSGTKIETDIDVADYLFEAVRVAVVPGSPFGLGPFLRLSLASSEAVLDGAVMHIAEAVGKLK